MAFKTPGKGFLAPESEPDNKKFKISILKNRCKGCFVCIVFCPRKILEQSTEFNVKGYHPPRLVEGVTAEQCSGCMFCQLACPEFAIYIEEQK